MGRLATIIISSAITCLTTLVMVVALTGQQLPPSCPIDFQKVDPHYYDEGKDPWNHYLRVEYKNVSDKTIIAIRFGVAFVDMMAETNESV